MAESLNQQLHVAGVYAQALFELAVAAGAIDTYRSELEGLVEAERANPQFADFMSSVALSADKREAGLERMFRGRLSDDVLNTLLVMNRHGRIGLAAALLRTFIIAQERHGGQVEVTVTSAVELSADQRKAVEQTAADICGGRPLIEYEVEASLLGGLVMQIGDIRYDNSVRRHLLEAQRRLEARAARGLELTVKQ